VKVTRGILSFPLGSLIWHTLLLPGL